VVTGAGSVAKRGAILDELGVRLALEDVADPEIPGVSIVDLGMVRDVSTGPAGIAVALLPTYLGCHATEAIRAAVTSRLAAFGRPVEVTFDLATTWSTERISPAGRERLRRSGFAPADEPGALRCPYCGSDRVVTDSLFGPTLCRSLHYCRACRQPFEAFKPV
jgi:ring-1,2-phenylacetyl-CoA epoxidase subunit PaaD